MCRQPLQDRDAAAFADEGKRQRHAEPYVGVLVGAQPVEQVKRAFVPKLAQCYSQAPSDERLLILDERSQPFHHQTTFVGARL